MTELLSDRIEAGHTSIAPDVETPQVLQAFVQVRLTAGWRVFVCAGGLCKLPWREWQRVSSCDFFPEVKFGRHQSVVSLSLQPHNDLRYVTTYIGGGANNVTCHTFQRKYSRRYVAQGSPLPPGAEDAFTADSSLAFGSSLAAQVRSDERAGAAKRSRVLRYL